jgi:hypothetical protein
MPDIPLAGPPGGPYDPSMEARIARLEEDMHEVKATVGRLEAITARLEMAIVRIETLLTATLPHLATKAELQELRTHTVANLAEKPSKTYMWGILAVLLTAYACGLAALAILK